MFYTGAWGQLQNIESKIALRVMTSMRERYDTLVLPVHDSFIVDEDLEHQLQTMMRDCYRDEMGFDISISKDDDLWSEMGRVSNENKTALFVKFFHGVLGPFSEYLHRYFEGENGVVAEQYSTWVNRHLTNDQIELLKKIASHSEVGQECSLLS